MQPPQAPTSVYLTRLLVRVRPWHEAGQTRASTHKVMSAIAEFDPGARCIPLEEMKRHSRADGNQERRMREEQFGGDTVYRVYERERLRRMARKLGLRLLKFSGGRQRAEKATGDGSRSKRHPVLMIDSRKRAASE